MIFRAATLSDLEDLVDVQQEGAVHGLSHIFPQDTHPFPRMEVVRRWTREIADPGTYVYVSTDEAGNITGFAATRGTELLHFGTSVQTWGTGLASEVHDAVLHTFAATTSPDGGRIRLRVFEKNHRARRFYERLGWSQTGHRTRTSFPPHPVLLEYDYVLGRHETRPIPPGV